MEFIREDCIYARQSVDRKDSISIESQIDFCKYELKGGSCRVFKDKGYSGKNTDRPEFQKLLGEIRKGKVRRVIVYKLDRISRSILDFATMMELFQEYDVEFVSSTEKFDTSTPMGRAMLNICIVFAQLERETIQKRVTDAYYSRCLKGFHMSGQAPYGYQLEPTVVEGIRTKKMVADPVAADHVRLMFEMYAEPETSFGDITRYFEEHDIKIYGKSMFRTFLSQLLRNPVYAQADLELYEFFKSQGAAIVNDASDFAGTNGCYLYKGRDVKEDKDSSWDTLKKRLHERLDVSKNIVLFLSSNTKNSQALREEIDYGINTKGLPVIVIYPDFKEKSDIWGANGMKKQVTDLWDELPIFRDSMSEVATIHVPYKKTLISSALKDPDFKVQTMTKAGTYHYRLD